MSTKPFIDLGQRNKGTFWEYLSAYSFLHTKLPYTQYDIPTFLGFGQGDSNKHCHHRDVIEAAKQLLITEFESGVYTDDFFKQIDDLYRKPLEALKVLMKKDFSHDSPEELSEKINFTVRAIAETHKPMLQALKTLYLNDYFEHELRAVLNEDEKNNVSQIAVYTALLLTPTRVTQAQLEEEQLFDLQKIFEDRFTEYSKESFEQFIQQPDVEERILHLTKTAGYFHMEYSKEPWTDVDYESELLKRIQAGSIKGMDFPETRRKDIIQQQNDFFEHQPSSEKLKKLCHVLQEFSYVLDASKVVLVEGFYIVRPLWKHIAKKLGVSLSDFLYLVLPEIEDLLRQGKSADMNLIKKRKQARAVLLKDGIISVYEGDAARELGKELIEEADLEHTKEVKGMIAYPGTVTGKVVVIRSVKDRDKFAKGDIMVAADGPAEFTWFLKQASAIVTDQGGMISHVAIIAREMKTPCVVATKIATKVFNDGDIVEVNADEGIITLVN